MWTVIGLGNPGKEYENNRHNTGFLLVDFLVGKGEKWEKSNQANCFYVWTKIDKKKVEFIKPQTFMNKSGKTVDYVKKNHKLKSENIIIIYDDLDLPLGTFKISFNRGAGGHRGLESIIKALKSKKFIRIRVGISQTTSGGKLKKPQGEKKIIKFLIGDYKKDELLKLKKLSKKVFESLEMIIAEGKEKTMSLFN